MASKSMDFQTVFVVFILFEDYTYSYLTLANYLDVMVVNAFISIRHSMAF